MGVWAVDHRPYKNRIQFTCASCGQPLGVTDKGGECIHCKMWPLCAGCMDTECREHKKRTERCKA